MRSVIKREKIQVEERDAARPRSRPQGEPQTPHAASARVRLIQLDASTQAIELTCSCGEVSLIEVQCEKKP